MAQPKTSSKAAPPKPKGKMGVNKYDEQLAALAATSAIAEESALTGGAFLSTKGGRLSFGGAPVPGDKMNVVVIASCLENVYYDVPFDANSPASPVCYAFGQDDKVMGPHDKAPEPQSEQCHGCPMNEFGTAERGKGKACANVRRLALIPESGLDDIEGTEVAYLKVAVMSVKNWAGYVTQIASALKRPPLAVVTEISVVPDDKSQFRIQFRLVREIKDSSQLSALLEKNALEMERIGFPYSVVEREEAPAPSRKGPKAAPKSAKRPAAPPAKASSKAAPAKPFKGRR